MNWDNGYTKITTETINRIPCKRIVVGRWSQSYNEYIQYLIKKVLYTSMVRKDEPGNEVGILARIDGKYELNPIYGHLINGYPTIDTLSDIDYMNVITHGEINKFIFVHNHPNNSVLSIGDIRNFMPVHVLNAVVAVGNNGVIHYISKVSTEYSYYEYVMRLYNRYIISHYNEEVEEAAYRYLCNNRIRFKLNIV